MFGAHLTFFSRGGEARTVGKIRRHSVCAGVSPSCAFGAAASTVRVGARVPLSADSAISAERHWPCSATQPCGLVGCAADLPACPCMAALRAQAATRQTLLAGALLGAEYVPARRRCRGRRVWRRCTLRRGPPRAHTLRPRTAMRGGAHLVRSWARGRT